MFNIFEERATKKNLQIFADELIELSNQIGFKVSSRGWCYQLESARLINKDQFDRVENIINKCRREGYLPIDFVAEEEGRKFSGVEEPTLRSPQTFLIDHLEYPMRCENWYTPDWWDGEEYYIQMLVEKIDLKTLFTPVCEKYHIPVATSKGWSSMLQRAEYAKRFKEAEDKGLICVLLYCGDHDPDGLRISDFIMSNLEDIKNVTWEDGTEGYNPKNLIIKRFGLDYNFIIEHRLTWIENLITSSGKDLGLPNHKNHKMPYVQHYLKSVGRRKCEANAIVPMPKEARELVTEAITDFLGFDALDRFKEKTLEIKRKFKKLRDDTGLSQALKVAINKLGGNEDEEE